MDDRPFSAFPNPNLRDNCDHAHFQPGSVPLARDHNEPQLLECARCGWIKYTPVSRGIKPNTPTRKPCKNHALRATMDPNKYVCTVCWLVFIAKRKESDDAPK